VKSGFSHAQKKKGISRKDIALKKTTSAYNQEGAQVTQVKLQLRGIR